MGTNVGGWEKLKGLAIGVVLTLAVELLIAFIFLEAGGLYMGADLRPGGFETWAANWMLDSSVNTHAQHRGNPYPMDDSNLITGAREYQEHCSICHGGLVQQESPLQHSVYPGAPQFVAKKLGKGGDPQKSDDWRMHYMIQHGVRWTAMPAWDGQMQNDEIWKVVMFLQNMGKLPAPVMAAWRQTAQQQSAAQSH